MKLKKNKFIIGLSTTVLGSALAAGSQVAYADEPVDISSSQTTGVNEISEPSEVNFTEIRDGSDLGGELVETPSENDPQAESVDEANSDTSAESVEDKEQNPNDTAIVNETEEDSTNVTEKDSDDKQEAGDDSSSVSEATSSDEESVLPEPTNHDKDSIEAELVEETEVQAAEAKTEEGTEEPVAENLAGEDKALDTDAQASEADENPDVEVDAGAALEDDADAASTDVADEAQASKDQEVDLTPTDTAVQVLGAQALTSNKLVEEGAPIDGVLATAAAAGPTPYAAATGEATKAKEPNYKKDAESLIPKDENGELPRKADGSVDDSMFFEEVDKVHKESGDELALSLKSSDASYNKTAAEKANNVEGVRIEVLAPSKEHPTEFYELAIITNTAESGRAISYMSVQNEIKGSSNTPNSNIPSKGFDVKPIAEGDKTAFGKIVTDVPDGSINVPAPDRFFEYRKSTYEIEDDLLKAINDNDTVVFGFRGKYTKKVQDDEREEHMFTSKGFKVGYALVPFPNENKKGDLITLDTSNFENKIYPVKEGEVIGTGITINNLLNHESYNDEDRLVAKVYDNNGDQIDDVEVFYEDGQVKVRLPKGALESEDSIFYPEDGKLNKYKDLNIELFMRPRTEEELETEVYGFNSDITNLNQDKFARYNHYNKVGKFDLKLDDESNYDIITKDKTNGKTVTDKILRLKAGVDKETEQVDNPNSLVPNKYKTAKANEEAVAYLEEEYKDFLIPVEGEDNKFRTKDNWLVEVDPNNPEKIKVSTPIGAKKGENLTLPVTYLFTNGSEKNFLMSYVVNEESIEKPNYEIAEAEAGQEVSNTPTNEYTEVKPKPVKYELESTSIVDNKGKTWTLSIDENTGVITATAPGEVDKSSTINVPVIATYVDQKLKDIDGNDLVYTERSSATFTATAPQEGIVRFTQDNTIDFETIVRNNPDKDPAESGVVQEGKNGKYTADYNVTYKDGEVVEGPTMIEGTERDRVEPINQIFEIGTKGTSVDVTAPDEQIIKIPYTTEITYDENQPVGYRKETPGEDGEKKITYEIIQQDGKATVKATETITKEVTPRKIIIGTKPNELGVDFNPEIDVKVDNTKDVGSVDTEVVQGEYKTVTKNVQNPDGSIVTIEEVVEITKPKQIITVGTKDYTGDVTHTTTEEIPFDADFVENPDLEAGTTRVTKEGVVGTREVTYTIPVRNGELDTTDGKKITSESNETKAAENEIIEVGTKPVEKVVEIPFNTEYIYDNNLAAGTTQTDKEGVVGYKKLVTTYDEANKTSVTTVADEKAAENKVVRIGGKITGTQTVTESVPFEVEVETDPTLKKGDWKYAEDADGNKLTGKAGEQTRTLTIVNGAITETSDPTTTINPINAKILVGSDDFTGNVTHEVTEAIPFEVKIEKDPNMKLGDYEVVTPGKAGSKTTRYTQAIKNGQADGTLQSEEDKDAYVAPTTEVIKVGSAPVADVTKDVNEEIGVTLDFQFDENLDKGKYRTGELVKGKVENVVTTTFDPATGEMTSTETRQVTDAKQTIYIGSKGLEGDYTYTFEQEIPFDVQYVDDPTLDAGTTEVKQQGTAGTKTVTVTAKLVDGKAVEDSSKVTESVKQAATPQIVRVGTKTVADVKEVEVPYTSKTEADPEMSVGETRVEKGEVGKKTITVTTTRENGETTTTTKEVVTVEPTEEVVYYGTKPVVETQTVETPYTTRTEADPTMAVGETEVVTKGQAGKKTITITTSLDENGKAQSVVTEKVDSNPVEEVIKVGTKVTNDNGATTTKVIEIPFETEVITDDNLEKGKRVVDQTGEKGERTITVTTPVTNGVAGEPVVTDEVTKEPVKEIIRIGTKCEEAPIVDDKTVESKTTVPVQYETEIIYDDTISASKVIEEQKGVMGERTVTSTVVITNGVAGQPQITSKITKEPVKQIIRIGTKKTSSTDKPIAPSKPTPSVSPTTQTITREIPYDTVFIYDNTIEAGKKVVTSPGQKGEKIVTITSKLVDGKIVTQTTEEIIKQPKTEFVRVGTMAPQYNGEDVVTNESKVLIPFETEIIYDDTLPLGQTEVVSEGRDGIQVVTITTIYQNGLVVDTTTDGYVEREAINKVVRVGTKTDGQAPTIDENTGIIDLPTTTEDNDHIIVIPEGAIDDENHVVVIPEEAENDEDDANKKNRPVNDNQVVKGTKNIKVSEDDANAVNIKRSAVSSTNPKTGITGTAGIISTLAISLAGITASKRKKKMMKSKSL